jgi:hypothetical protein
MTLLSNDAAIGRVVGKKKKEKKEEDEIHWKQGNDST